MENKMANKNPKIEQLCPVKSKEEATLRGRNGGIRSGQVKREKKLMTSIYADLLADKYEVTINGEKVKIDGSKLVQSVARDILMRRDSSSVSLMKEIREATEGQNVNITGSIETSALTPEERKARIAELEAKRVK